MSKNKSNFPTINYDNLGGYGGQIQHLYESRKQAFGRLVFAICALTLALGFIYRVYDMSFNFKDFMTGLVQVDFGSFDFQGLVGDLDTWVEGLPSWLDWAGTGIRVIGYFALSGAYVIGFFVRVLGYIF